MNKSELRQSKPCKEQIKIAQRVELEILKHFADVCKREGLKWFAAYGTLLGAVRHKGFIPWDDDVDVVMPARDYDKLCANPQCFEKKYFLQTPLCEGRPFSTKLRKNGTTALRNNLVSDVIRGGHHGICIDILPIDEITGGKWVVCGRSELLPSRYFEEIVTLPFEDFQVNAPQNYLEVLDAFYPHGIEETQDRKEKTQHFSLVYEDRNYIDVIPRFTDMLNGSTNKDIFIFGAADSFRIWLKRYGLVRQLRAIFDNDSLRWGDKFFGIPVHNPAELPKMVNNNSCVIICSLYFREIGAQLEQLGIKEYYVFLDGFPYGDRYFKIGMTR